MTSSPDPLTVEVFAPNIGTFFRIEHAAATPVVELELVEATLAPATRQVFQSPRQPFSLLFRGVGNFSYPQGIYRLRHEKLGPLEIFLVPIGRDEKGLLLEAIFN